MKAMVYTEYGPPEVLKLKEVEKPTPQDNEVLVRIYATSVNTAEWYFVHGTPFLVRLMSGGILKPKRTIPGADIAGRVEAVGKGITHFKPGDEVFGNLSDAGWGAFAEYVTVPEEAIALKPATITFEEAGSVPLAGVTALQGLRNKGKIQSGQKVLITGAGGGVGVFAVQIAKALGAQVTAVCSTKKLDMVRSIGADRVIDYTKEDFTKNGQRYDLILDIAAYRPMSDYKRILTPKGIYVLVGGALGRIYNGLLFGPFMSMFGSQKMTNLSAKPDQQDLIFLKELFEAGKIVPVIDKCYPLAQTGDALHYFNRAHPHGKVVISLSDN